jgi:hypothetical protein
MLILQLLGTVEEAADAMCRNPMTDSNAKIPTKTYEICGFNIQCTIQIYVYDKVLINAHET